MATNIPFPDAVNPDDVLTDEQKQAIFRINMQKLIEHLEEGPRDAFASDNWDNILKANLPAIRNAIEKDIFTQTWINRGNVLLTKHQALLEQPAAG